jgi:HEAT repeat protein
LPSPHCAAFIETMQERAQREPRSPIDLVADRARWALGQADRGRLVEPLLAALHDGDWRVRAYAAWSLGHSGDARVTAPLAALLDDDVWRVRASAAAALRHMADPAASQAMRRALSDDAWQVRVEAVHYFAATGGSRVLFETMRRDRHVAVRGAAEEATE